MPIQIIKGKSFGSDFGRALGEGLGKGGMEGLNLGQENAAIKKNYGLDLAGVNDPNTRQQLIADQLAFGRKMKQAEATQNIRYTPEQMQDFVNENRPQQNQLPSFKAGEGKEPRSFNLGREESFGQKEQPSFSHAAQPETQGKKRQVLTPDQIREEGLRIAKEQTSRGIPTTAPQGYEIAKDINNENKIYNSEVEKDIDQIVRSQEKYGLAAAEELSKLYPEASGEHIALARRWGEEAVNEGHSKESDIARVIAQKTKQFKNTIANVKKSVPAPRLGERAKQAVLGTSRLAEKSRDDIRVKLSPLLREGLYDTARNLLSELGYHPEERESIITDLGENAKKSLAQFPSLKKDIKYKPTGNFTDSSFDSSFSPEQIEKVSSNMKDILKSDPSTNLILLRKAYEDKGVDWQTFKDSLNDMIQSGEITLNDDQFNHLDLLDYPPLDRLDTILHGMGLIGR